jgi:hypothetical protein
LCRTPEWAHHNDAAAYVEGFFVSDFCSTLLSGFGSDLGSALCSAFGSTGPFCSSQAFHPPFNAQTLV